MRTIAWCLAVAILSASPLLAATPIEADFVLKGGTIVDGTGAPASKGDLAVRGDRIVAVGTFEADPKARVIDASGLVVTPGFIDLHTHSDGPIVVEATRDNRNYQWQGVTTIVTGNCGGGTLDVAKYFELIERHGAGANVIHLLPQGNSLRRSPSSAGRRPSSPDARPNSRRMKAVADSRDGGRSDWGMSTGLIYVPKACSPGRARVDRDSPGWSPSTTGSTSATSATKAPA